MAVSSQRSVFGWMDVLCFMGQMGQMTPKGNEVKRKMKRPSDIPMPRFELRWLTPVANLTTSELWRHPVKEIHVNTILL